MVNRHLRKITGKSKYEKEKIFFFLFIIIIVPACGKESPTSLVKGDTRDGDGHSLYIKNCGIEKVIRTALGKLKKFFLFSY